MLVTSKNHDLKGGADERRAARRLAVRAGLAADDGGLHGAGELRHLANERRILQPPGARRPTAGRARRPLPPRRARAARTAGATRSFGACRAQGREAASASSGCSPGTASSRSPSPTSIPSTSRSAAASGCDQRGRQLHALAATSRKARIAADELKGNTGDPWTPSRSRRRKALSITGEGFSYRRMVELLLGQRVPEADPAGAVSPATTSDQGFAVLARAIARGQGKTEGYHERIVPISKEVVQVLPRPRPIRLPRWPRIGSSDAGTLRGQVLRPGPILPAADRGPTASTTARRPRLPRPNPGSTASSGGSIRRSSRTSGEKRQRRQNDRAAIRQAWLRALADAALELLDEASRSVPQAAMRRYRAKVRSRGLFFFLLRKHFPDLKHEDAMTAPPDVTPSRTASSRSLRWLDHRRLRGDARPRGPSPRRSRRDAPARSRSSRARRRSGGCWSGGARGAPARLPMTSAAGRSSSTAWR